MKMELERILLVRHALSGGNNAGIIQGRLNIPIQSGYKPNVDKLTDLIIAEELLKQLEPDTPVYVLHSKLDRAFYTASRIHSGLTERHIQSGVHPIPELAERGAGILEGKKYADAIPILQQLLPPGTDLQPNAESIYPHLYALDNIPGAEKHEEVGTRLPEALSQIQSLKGVVIVVGHGISMNYLKNLMTEGNILGDPSRPYQHFPNLSVVRLERERGIENHARYIVTGTYGPPNNKANGGQANDVTASRLVQTGR